MTMYVYIRNAMGQIRPAEVDEDGNYAAVGPAVSLLQGVEYDPGHWPLRVDFEDEEGFAVGDWETVPMCPKCGYDGEHACGLGAFIIEETWLRHNIALALFYDPQFRLLVGPSENVNVRLARQGIARAIAAHVSNNAKQIMLAQAALDEARRKALNGE
jgi:hypothetical protein